MEWAPILIVASHLKLKITASCMEHQLIKFHFYMDDKSDKMVEST